MNEHDSVASDLHDPKTQNRSNSARGLLTSWLVLLHIYAMLLTLIVAAFLLTDSLRDYSWVIAELDNGGIMEGDRTTKLIPARPVLQEARHVPDGTEFGMAAFRARGNLLLVYAKDGNLFAANYIHTSSVPQFERWYFCDREIMDEYIQLALSKSGD